MFSSIKNVHFVGIGGIGMSAIAEILISQGFSVTGSDLSQSENTDYLSNLGAKIFIGHDLNNIKGAEVVVYSSAVKPNENQETLEAMKKNIPLLRRAEMLSEVTKLNYCLAVAGTHGKTTTTSMCGLAMMNAKYEPTVIVGGRLRGLGGTNARLGKGEWTVVEADEYDRSFLQLFPTIAVINNIEPEHLDIYRDYEDLKNTFLEFANKVPFYGFVALGIDDDGVKDILSGIKKKVVTFGLSRHSDYRADDLNFNERNTTFKLIEKGEYVDEITIKIPGLHNVKNALASISVNRELGVDISIIKQALGDFSGVNRRFEIKGEKDGVLVIDDYGHHPTEIEATLNAARKGWNRRIICVFQPHTFSRTAAFYKEFGRSFDDADILIVSDIYPAREKPIEGITGKIIADAASQYGHKNVLYIPDLNLIYPELKKILKKGDIVITVGAGDVWKISKQLI